LPYKKRIGEKPWDRVDFFLFGAIVAIIVLIVVFLIWASWA